jgi:dephospho-CoA kinase
MVRIALTGGIATGKTYVRRRLEMLGVPTIDADLLARAVASPGSPAFDAIRARFGASVVAPDGSLDRRRLADIVFRDPGARVDLERIIHPHVYAAIQSWFGALSPDTDLAVADIPLLFETGRERDFDRVVVVACDAPAQVRRVIDRDGASEAEARRRIAAQLPIEEKVKRADSVVWTNGSLADTDAQVEQLVHDLRRRSTDIRRQ